MPPVPDRPARNAQPNRPAHHSPPRRGTAHMAGIAAIAVFVVLAAAYMVTGYEPHRLYDLIRAGACVAAVALHIEVRTALVRREQRAFEEHIEDRLNRAEWADGYIAGAKRRPPGGSGGHLRSV